MPRLGQAQGWYLSDSNLALSRLVVWEREKQWERGDPGATHGHGYEAKDRMGFDAAGVCVWSGFFRLDVNMILVPLWRFATQP
jgi:hypothetical protein